MNLPWETLNALSERMTGLAGQVLWQSSLLILALWMLDLLLKRRVRASARYALWLLVLLKLLIPPSFSSPSSLAWWMRPSRPPSDVPSHSPAGVRVTFLEPGLPPVKEASGSLGPAPAPGPSLAAVGLMGSLLVTAGLLCWIIRRQRQFSSILRRASPAPSALEGVLAEAKENLQIGSRVRLLITAERISPALCGLVRPAILLPESVATRLTKSQLRAVLLHELVHLKRGDVWISCLQSLLQIVLWWHPLLWFANAKIRRLREEAVDDAVIYALSNQPSDYATSLLEVARLALRRPFAALGFVGILESSASLKGRIERLLDSGTQRKTGLGLVSALWITAFAAVALPMGPAVERGTVPTQTFRPGPESNARSAQATSAVGPEITGALPSSEPLQTRAFKVDPNAFRAGVLRALAKDANATNTTGALVVEFFRSRGITFSSPKSFYYKPREGALLLRATATDLDAVENAIEELAMTPATVHASIRAALLTPAKAAEFWAGLPPGSLTNKLAALNKENETPQWERLKQLAGPGTKAQAEISTRSGRQAQIHIGENRFFVKESELNSQPTPLQKDSPAESFPPRPLLRTDQVPVGLKVDFLPYVGIDMVEMHITGAFTEFLGYDDPGQFVPQDGGTGARPVTAPLPLPHFRIRRLEKWVIAGDGQTVVIGGSEEIHTHQVPGFGGDRPPLGKVFRRDGEQAELILFVTATVQ